MRSIVLAAAAALCTTGAWAQSIKPGLWEISNRMQGAAGSQMAQAQAQMQEQMRSMSPEQRKMIEEMMSKQGVRMGQGGPGGMTVQVCITPEMAQRSEVPMNKGDCRVTSQQRSGSTMKSAFSCSNPPSTGEAQVTFSGPEAYSSKVMVNTTVNGRPETMNMDSTGKWLGSDCGSVKPPAKR